MNRPIIRVDKLSKRYILRGGEDGLVRFSLREAVNDAASSMRRMLLGKSGGPTRRTSEFWALKDAEFEVERGRVVGLIGRNGAGKSTILKIMSRIVDPTSGSIHLRGRVASLLEVGTGFHLDLSGRENIYLNGAILGMRRAEIARKFDEIVAFAEVDRFLDTPVKRYSSGMFVRLAFAVAAHLEPEILIVDEVLAVGDYAFQKKCLGKMREVATGEGRTVLFVSHNMGALGQLCDDGVWLEKGRVSLIGPVDEVIRAYMKSDSDRGASGAQFAEDLSKPSQFVEVEVLHEDGSRASDFTCDEPIRIRMVYQVRKPVMETYISFYVQNMEGTRVLHSDVRDLTPEHTEALGIGTHTFEVVIPARLLAATGYVLTVGSAAMFTGVLDHHYDCCEFTLRDLNSRDQSRPGVLGVQLPWCRESTLATADAGHA
ncbi:ABC transporter ATP-binding protein [Paludisphaera mucosa]|uniref:ABC transporter ATP-binding protein n=1 Tax=Paludisphaera mucosa TaxID=3030827 RepID=A0ABT6FKP5_9BACT|nr:ABC transporter ATP-binding protein [Paludisphaera mucosa]MDG3008120.1 ABC transporter ATP-binding protein [Paludisphaera mucosa]